MNRLVSWVMLVAFVAQHMMCCCTGTAAHSCDHEHLPPSESNHADHEDCPCDHSHQHHYCIGTHVFFLSAPRAEMPASIMHHDFGFGSLDVSIHGVMTCLAAASRHGVDSGPPLSSCPQRSALCVYRI